MDATLILLGGRNPSRPSIQHLDYKENVPPLDSKEKERRVTLQKHIHELLLQEEIIWK